jgi:hypothetical protein
VERRLSRTLDQLELLEKRAARLEVRLKVWGLEAQEVERLLLPLREVPPTPVQPPPLPVPPSQAVPQSEAELMLPVVHRPEALEQLEPMPPAEDQLQALLLQDLGSPITTSSSNSSAV